MKLGSYAKSIVALVGFVVTTGAALDWGIEFPSWVPAATSLVTAVCVYLVPNRPYVSTDPGPGEYPTGATEADYRPVDNPNG